MEGLEKRLSEFFLLVFLLKPCERLKVNLPLGSLYARPAFDTPHIGAAMTRTLEKHMPTGTVKWFNSTKGYGFIQPDNGGADVFVHISAVERAGLNGLKDGQKISFEEERDPRKGKTAAVNLKAL